MAGRIGSRNALLATWVAPVAAGPIQLWRWDALESSAQHRARLRLRETCPPLASTWTFGQLHKELQIETQMIESEVLLRGYALGVFPMAMENGEIEWFSPDPRTILPLDTFHVSRTLQQVWRKGIFEIRLDTRFTEVIGLCAAREDTWINPEIVRSYTHLHELGHAHSVETWKDGHLEGGLYGVSLGGAFFGESMFHRTTNASKIALVALVEHLRARRFTLLDTQWMTSHLRRFGAIEIPRPHYIHLLSRSVQLTRTFLD